MTSGEIRERLFKLRAVVEAQAEMMLSQIDALAAAIAADEVLHCPNCGEADEDRLENTPVMGGEDNRYTCLSCGKSFHEGDSK